MFSACDRSFDGLVPCDVNDTMFVDSHVARKGGAVAISNGDELSSRVDFYRCIFHNSTAGTELIEDDAQGEGGVFSVGDGVTLLLSHCTLTNNSCGKKVRHGCRCIS